jgi:hypothetical protein
MNKLYDAFTFKGELAEKWQSYGVSTTYDAETKSLELTLPEGWFDTMSAQDKMLRRSSWNLDDPTFNVDYDLVLKKGAEAASAIAKLHVVPREGDELEFRTSNAFEAIGGLVPGACVHMQFRAHVKLKGGVVLTTTLIEGLMKAPETPAPLPNACSGIFFVLEGGFQFFATYGSPETITSISLVGKIEKLEMSGSKVELSEV